MTRVTAAITMSIDGYITGPQDGPGRGLGEGGERLHYWVFGGPWTYADEGRGEAGNKDVNVMGGAQVIRQALAAGLTIIIAPVVLGAGKRLFEGFSQSLELEHLGVRQSPWATFIDYRVKAS